jgi:hypothetical protein
LTELVFDLFDNRPHLARVRSARDNEGLDDTDDVSDIEDDDVVGLLVVRGLGRDP